MTNEERNAIKREALEELAQYYENIGSRGRASMVRDTVSHIYPPPPKRVRAEVTWENDGFCHSQGAHDHWAIGYGVKSFGVPKHIFAEIAALVARADADGMVLEGETATPQPQQKAREWWVNVYDDDPPQWFAHASQSIADKNGGHKEHERIHVREVLPTEKPAPTTRRITRDDVVKLLNAFDEKTMENSAWAVYDMMVALGAIGLEVEE